MCIVQTRTAERRKVTCSRQKKSQRMRRKLQFVMDVLNCQVIQKINGKCMMASLHLTE